MIPFIETDIHIKNTIKAGGSTAICKMWSGWMDGWVMGDTP